MRRGWMFAVTVAFLLGGMGDAQCQESRLAGLYRVDAERHVIVRGSSRDDLSVLDTRTGTVRNLTSAAERRFEHGPTRSRTSPVVGRVTFAPGEGLAWTSEALGTLQATLVNIDRQDVTIDVRDGGRLRGVLFSPPDTDQGPLTVVVPLGDRQSVWELAMWLVAAGQRAFVYDQRGSGTSTGELLGPPSSHTIETLQLADDALTVIAKLRELPSVDRDRVGILGWSQGGWVAAMAASRDPTIAWYVNIAANANPWPEQAEHRFVARLMREGFEAGALEEGRTYFTALRAVTDFRVGWDAYARVRDGFINAAWYQKITEIFPFFTYSDYGDALSS